MFRDVSAGERVKPRPETLLQTELALEELPAAPDRSSRIALDHVDRGILRVDVPLPRTDLLAKRLRDAASGRIDVEGLVDELLIYLAPSVIGDRARGMIDLPALESLSAQRTLRVRDVRMIESDIRVIARPV